jgi:cytochrome c
MTRVFPQALSALVAFLAFAAAAQADTKGDDLQVAFNIACRTCHSMREGDNRLGPSLHGVVGRKAGSLEGYAYSSAMQQSGIVWDEKTLDAFIANPEQVVHGNGMKPFGGIDDAKQRGEIVAFLKSISE